MTSSQVNGIRVAGVAAAVSNKWTSLMELGAEDPAVIERFSKKTGVKGRYDAGLYQTTSDFCCAAAKQLLEEKKISPEEIGVLVFVTQTPDYALPATACVLQERLGLSRDCAAFDVNLGCSGFTYGLNIAASLLQISDSGKALLLAGDTSAKERSARRNTKTTHSANMLFGDAGTATLLVKEAEAQPIHMISRTDGSGFKAIISPYDRWRNPDIPDGGEGTEMDDVAVFQFAVNEVPQILKETMAITGCVPEDYACLALHQANLFILKQVAKRTGFPMEKTLVSLDEFANTSSSSIPISLVKEYGNCIEDQEIRVLSCGFGVGLSWSTADFFVNTKDILPLIHTDEYFTDGYSEISAAQQ